MSERMISADHLSDAELDAVFSIEVSLRELGMLLCSGTIIAMSAQVLGGVSPAAVQGNLRTLQSLYPNGPKSAFPALMKIADAMAEHGFNSVQLDTDD